MIMPTKHISINKSLIGVGGLILSHLKRPNTISNLWNTLRKHPDVVTFERFILTIDMLYAIGAVEMVDGLLRRCNS